MEITLPQTELELAVKQYVASSGIARPISNMRFSHSRKGEASTIVEIELAPLEGKVIETIEVPEENPFAATQKEAAPEVTVEVAEEESPFIEDEPASENSIFG